MKKLIALLTVLIVLAASVAHADPVKVNGSFSIRNGITYQMPRNMVFHIEDLNGSDKFASPVLLPCDLGYGTTLLGHEACIAYWFDNKLLDEFQYEMYSSTAYAAVTESLTNKYGSPLFTSSSPFDTRIFASKTHFQSRINNPSISTRDYRGWLVQYDDCYVIIEATSLYFKDLGTLYYVNYCPLSYEEVEKVMGNYQHAVDHDL